MGSLTQLTLLGVAQLEVLILELVAVDRLATSACMRLDHTTECNREQTNHRLW
jgi:hypothetical protein